MSVSAYAERMDMAGGRGSTDEVINAPWGINPATGKPYTKSPEERAAIGAQLSAARQAKAAARQAEAVSAPPPDPEEAVPVDRSTPDREPGKGRRRGRRGRPSESEAKPEAPQQPYRVGVITKGMNRIYAKFGRLVKLINPMVGEAIISTTRKDSEDDTTVGEAWEELARVNTVWRARLLKICAGGAAGQLFIAHLPIFAALLMLEPVKKRLPFQRVMSGLLFDEEEANGAGTAAGTGQPGGPGPFDDPDLMAMALQMMGPVLAQRTANQPRQPDFGTYEQPGTYEHPAAAA